MENIGGEIGSSGLCPQTVPCAGKQPFAERGLAALLPGTVARGVVLFLAGGRSTVLQRSKKKKWHVTFVKSLRLGFTSKNSWFALRLWSTSA